LLGNAENVVIAVILATTRGGGSLRGLGQAEVASLRLAPAERKPFPFWLRVSDRAAPIAGVALVISAGGAVACEMRKSGARLRVHGEAS
jgi:hypothetical protein